MHWETCLPTLQIPGLQSYLEHGGLYEGIRWWVQVVYDHIDQGPCSRAGMGPKSALALPLTSTTQPCTFAGAARSASSSRCGTVTGKPS